MKKAAFLHYMVEICNTPEIEKKEFAEAFEEEGLSPTFFDYPYTGKRSQHGNTLIIVENSVLSDKTVINDIGSRYRLIFTINKTLYHQYIIHQDKPEMSISFSVATRPESSNIKNIAKAVFDLMIRFSDSLSKTTNNQRFIEFNSQHKQAGLQILNYFQETLNQKYPDDDITVRIGQRGNLVTMEIETPDGNTEKYEEALEDYGLVVTGEKPVEEYLPNKLDQMALEFRMKNISTELEFTNKLLTMKDQVINSLEEDKGHFKQQILQLTNANIRLSERMADLAAASHSRDDSVELIKLLDTFFTIRGAEALTNELESIKENNQSLFSWIGSKMGEVGDKAAVSAASKGLLEYLQGYF